VGQGLAAVLKTRPDFELVACCDDLAGTIQCLESDPPDIALAYVTSGISLADLRELRSASARTSIVLWGQGLADEFVFQAMQLGIRGLLRGDSSTAAVLSCLERVRDGELCFQAEIMQTLLFQKRVVLTPRESQVVALVAQGLKNKEIAYSLGLTEGTIKVYVTRIFTKLEMNDRLDLALYGLKNLFGGQFEQPGETRHARPDQPLLCPRSLPLRTREANAPFRN
jgi:DNA-binding NarL/FixJ family response regulator